MPSPNRLRVSRSALLAAVALAVVASPAHAAWPNDPNNGNLGVCTAVGDQDTPAIVSDGAGGAIIAWRDSRSGTADIYAQRVNAAGVLQWFANGVPICLAPNDQKPPVITTDGLGGAIIAWADLRNGNYDIYAQRISAAGVAQWTTDGVQVCTLPSLQQNLVITSDGLGGAIMAWEDLRNGPTFDIYAQRVNTFGGPQWAINGVAICTAPFDQLLPMIAPDGLNGAIVCWVDRGGSLGHIYAQRVSSGGAAQWTLNGVAVCTATGDQSPPVIVADGTGGAIITWSDFRSASPGTSNDIYAQRINGGGVTQWILNGVALCAATGPQYYPVITSDGTGGAIVAWQDGRGSSYDIYAQHVSAGGTPQWPTDGVAVSTASNGQQTPTITSDGAGGAIVAWHDLRSGSYWDVYAQRVISSGAMQWTYDGAPISTAANDQIFPVLVPDGSSGAIITWYDRRTGGYDIEAQRIEQFGYLGNPEPVSTGVRDVPNDQGGKVKVSWNASYLDAQPYSQIDAYWILRSAPPNVVAQARASGARMTRDLTHPPAAGERIFLILPDQATGYAWEYLTSQPAFHVASYSYVAPTTSDSIGAGNPRTAFMIMAHTRNSGYWFSPPDSGYSVDNIPPSVPAPFAAAYSSGATHLHWGQNSEIDLAGYRMYRGSSSGFVPGPGNLISAQPDTGFNDVGSAGAWYKLSAIDAHGNESVYAILGPTGTLDAPRPGAGALSLAAGANPSANGADLRFALPAETRVTLVLFDQQGRRVRELAGGTLPAGEHSARWNGRDQAGGAAPSGIYFARLETMGRTLVVRFAMLR